MHPVEVARRRRDRFIHVFEVRTLSGDGLTPLQWRRSETDRRVTQGEDRPVSAQPFVSERPLHEVSEADEIRVVTEPLDVDVWTAAPKNPEHIAPLTVRLLTTCSEALELAQHLLRRSAHPEHRTGARQLDADPSLDLPAIQMARTKDEEVNLCKAAIAKEDELSGTLEGSASGILGNVEHGAEVLEQGIMSGNRNVNRQVDVDGASRHTEERARQRATKRLGHAMAFEDLTDEDDELKCSWFHHEAGCAKYSSASASPWSLRTSSWWTCSAVANLPLAMMPALAAEITSRETRSAMTARSSGDRAATCSRKVPSRS